MYSFLNKKTLNIKMHFGNISANMDGILPHNYIWQAIG